MGLNVSDPLDTQATRKGVDITEEQFTLRLVDGPFPTGEIDLLALTRIGGALRELSVRVGRWRANTLHTGRSPEQVEELTKLRLTALGSGSTVLSLARGSAEYLDIDDDLSRQVNESFWDVISAIGSNQPPGDAPALVRNAAADVIEALRNSCQRAEFASSSDLRHRADITLSTTDREVWIEPTRGEVGRMHGSLEMIDLKTSHFRLRDQVGNAIALRRVVDSAEAAKWVGRAVVATGTTISKLNSTELDEVTITLAEPVDVLEDSLDIELAKPGPSRDGGADLDDQEYDAFLAAARG